MQTTKIYRLPYQKPEVFERLKAAQMEAAKVWNECTIAHQECRINQIPWLNQTALQKLTKGKYQLHSQSVQMVCQAFLANIDSTRANRKAGIKNLKYPWRTKGFYPVAWAAQSVKYELGTLTLPMGRGRKSLSFKLDLDFIPGAVSLVWNRGFELHIKKEVQLESKKTTGNKATIDLGEIHICAVTTNTGQGLIVSGRGIRSLKRQRNVALAKLSRKQLLCTKYSQRWKKLQKAKNKFCLRNSRQIKEYRHQATRQVVEFCKTHDVDTVFIGNPDGVRKKNCGRCHNQRMTQWEYGQDIDYLRYKFKMAGISVLIGNERGTSSTCPECGHRHKPKGRTWNCPKCSYKKKHRDITGSLNMHNLAFGEKAKYPETIKYLRPVITGSSRWLDTAQSNLRLTNTTSTSSNEGNQLICCPKY
ncbi:MAG: transposase [Xenococcaceae cyanobacterium MO_207.B15]|nr:transposase [Xenococcaceae cyanobacterium MO_207.B15]MDJ0743776.1 transposase [Xenococcaceae cyanobacterium MO_167.B27]